MVIYRQLAPGGMDGRALGRDEKKPSTVIFEDMPVSPAMEKLTGQFKLCMQNVIKDLTINCHFICMCTPLTHYKLCKLQSIKTILHCDKINNKTSRAAWLYWMNLQAHLKELCETKHCADVLMQTHKIFDAIVRVQL